MCRVAYIKSKDKNPSILAELFKDLEESAGGDGNGVGGFIRGNAHIIKSVKTPAAEFAGKYTDGEWDNGFVFHTRRASVGQVNNTNCHPFIWGNTITIHNGHVEGFGLLKLMMLENLDKYKEDGWSIEKIRETTDSDILAYFVWKRGFEVIPMMDCGTVITMYPKQVRMYVGYCLEAISVNGEWIYASEFSDKMGLTSDKWIVFGKGTELTIEEGGNCVINRGYYVDGKELWKEMQKKKRRGKNKNTEIDIEVV